MNVLVFTDPRFLFLFLPLVLLEYALTPRIFKNTLLLAASIAFYALGEGFSTAVILFSIVFNYFMGHAIDVSPTPARRRSALALAVGVNLFLLIVFKYALFIISNLNLPLALVHLHIPSPRIHLPVGISFFTFHAISYVTDVYRREVKPMRRFDSFALYITLFPQLIAGPIIRYKTICDQFTLASPDAPAGRRHTWEGFSEGVRRFIIGLGKKMLIANLMAEVADGIFSTPNLNLTPGAAWMGIICYALQIYFDFSGYSDMAIGLGHMFGFRFPENFNYPYIATSVTEFWRRWHMSLSSWFRDYLYIPLGGNRVAPARMYLNLLIVFFLCGLWHGATWNFVFWGLFNGLFLIIERLGMDKILLRFPRILRHAYLLLFMLAGWVFFRAPSLSFAGHYFARLIGLGFHPESPNIPASVYLHRQFVVALIAGCIGCLPWLPALRAAFGRWVAAGKGWAVGFGVSAARSLELAALTGVFLASSAFSANGTYNPFIYFRF